MNAHLHVALVSCICAGACRPSAEATRSALLDADREFARQSQVRRLDAWLDAVADSGVVLRPGSPVARGAAATRERLAPAYADSATLNWEPVLAEASRSGDLGYTVGLSQSSRRGPLDARTMSTGKYVTIWKRQADGTWKIALHASVVD